MILPDAGEASGAVFDAAAARIGAAAEVACGEARAGPTQAPVAAPAAAASAADLGTGNRHR